MHAFSFEELLVPTVTIAIFAALITQLAIKNPVLSMIAAVIKAGAFMIYFSIIFDGTHTFLDDWTYLERARILFNQDITVFNMVDRWEYIKMMSGGSHVIYYLYNCMAMNVFGDYYFSPVAFNIVLTCAIAAIGKKILSSHLQLTNLQEKLFYFYVLLHPDIFAWSTIANLKDILILFLHLVLILGISFLFKNQFLKSALTAAPSIYLLFFSRFYVPVFFASSLVLTVLRNKTFKGRIPLIVATLAITFMIFGWIGTATFESGASAIDEKTDNPVYGFIRMMLTPIPFHTEIAYSFLNVPALIHWLLLPAFLKGFFRALKIKTLFFNFMTTYLVCFLAFYSCYTELQGPRHRVQLDYAIACFQFIGILLFLKLPVKEKYTL